MIQNIIEIFAFLVFRSWVSCNMATLLMRRRGGVLWIIILKSIQVCFQVEVYCTSTAGPTSTCWWWISTRWTWTLSAHNRSNYLTKCVYVLIDRFQVLFVAVLIPGSDDPPADVLHPFLANGKDAALDSRRLCCQSYSTTTCWKLSGKKKRKSNTPSISKWGNTVIGARRRTSCSLGGYESPWAPGGAIFIPGEIVTRREYWKPFFSQLNQF